MSKYETQAGRPTRGLVYAKLTEHLREAQDCLAMMSHLHDGSDDMDRLLAKGWLGMEEMFKLLIYKITELAKGNLNA